MYRPDVTKYFPTLIRNKFKTIKRFCPSDIRVSEILKETYDVLIYQETFLHLSKQIAGLSFAEAELWRKKMMRDKSNIEVIDFSTVFTNGCRIHSTLNETDITSLSNLIAEMIHLIFPKGHAMSYSIISYWGAYYKTHFLSQFKKAFSTELKF